jgi:hypothetical protein
MVSGLDELEITGGGSGGGASGGASGTGGGADPGCVVGWAQNDCRGQCGDEDDGIQRGCGNFMDCYVMEHCLPEVCSANIDAECGINKIQDGTALSLAMAEEVVNCLCYPPPP